MLRVSRIYIQILYLQRSEFGLKPVRFVNYKSYWFVLKVTVNATLLLQHVDRASCGWDLIS